MKTLHRILTEYRKWQSSWDELCGRCGQCCYTRSFSRIGEVVVDYSAPCEFLEINTCLCRVYKDRFHKCNHCGSVNLFHALFNLLMPPGCIYVKTFRVWLKRS